MSNTDIIYGLPICVIAVLCSFEWASFWKRLIIGLSGVIGLTILLGIYGAVQTTRVRWGKEFSFILTILLFGGINTYLLIFFVSLGARKVFSRISKG